MRKSGREERAAVNAPQSRRFAKFKDACQTRQRLECGDFSTAFTCGVSASGKENQKWLTLALIPAFSPPSSLRFDAIAPKPKAKADRRRRIVRRVFEMSCGGDCRSVVEQPEDGQRLFPLRLSLARGSGRGCPEDG